MAKTNRRCLIMYERWRLQEEDTEDVPAEIDDADVRQMFQNFLWHIESHQIVVQL